MRITDAVGWMPMQQRRQQQPNYCFLHFYLVPAPPIRKSVLDIPEKRNPLEVCDQLVHDLSVPGQRLERSSPEKLK